MDKLLLEYADTFNQNFPLGKFNGVEEKEIIKMLKKALETGTPVKAEYKEGATY